jgi:hypothetical protein
MRKENSMMSQHEAQQQSSLFNPQLWGQTGQQFGQHNYGHNPNNSGLGQAAFGQNSGYGMGFGHQRQLTAQDANEVVRQLLPLLPQIIAQAQQQPQAAFGYGGGYGFGQRNLTQQDVNEVVRQILPIVPQIVAQLQGQPPTQAIYGQGQHAGPFGFGYGWGANQSYQSYQQNPGFQQPWQQQWPQMQAAFGGYQHGMGGGQRQLSQQDVTEVARQLASILPQVIQNLQATGQQRNVC